MKNSLIICAIIIVVIIIITAISLFFLREKPIQGYDIVFSTEEQFINHFSDLPIDFMSKYDANDSRLNDFTRLDNYMSKDFSNDDIYLNFYGYPNDESEYHLCRVSLRTNRYNILGVTVGDNMKTAISKLEDCGFVFDSSNNDYIANASCYDQNADIEYKINIEGLLEDDDVAAEDVVIGSITLEVESTYLGNRVY